MHFASVHQYECIWKKYISNKLFYFCHVKKKAEVKDELNEILTRHNRSAPIIMLASLYLANFLM